VHYQVGDGLWCDVVDDCEGGEEEDGGRFGAFGVVGVGGGNRHVGGGEHKSLSTVYQHRHLENCGSKVFGERHTPFVGLTPHFSTASITLPFSSATSRAQSVFPVATIICVAQPLTNPYSFSSSSILHLAGYLTSQDSQSWSQSSPSMAGSTLGKRDPSAAVVKPLLRFWEELLGVRSALPRLMKEESLEDISKCFV